MTTVNKPIKCVSRDFKTSPFYLIQSNGPDKRLVASFQNKEDIKAFLFHFIDASKKSIEVKIWDFENAEKPVDFSGQVDKTRLKSILDKHEEVIFHDGYHDLLLGQPETGDYLVFDEHGLIFVYAQDDCSTTMEKFGLVHKTNEKLTYQYDHWHYRPANAREKLKGLITELKLR